MSGRLCDRCGRTPTACLCREEPGWGRKHVHEFAPTTTIGDVTIERCTCGQRREVIIVKPDQP